MAAGQFSDSASNHDKDRKNILWPLMAQFSYSPSNHDNDRMRMISSWPMANFQILRAIMIMIAEIYFGNLADIIW